MGLQQSFTSSGTPWGAGMPGQAPAPALVPQEQPQEIVDYFKPQSQGSDMGSIAAIMGMMTMMQQPSAPQAPATAIQSELSSAVKAFSSKGNLGTQSFGTIQRSSYL